MTREIQKQNSTKVTYCLESFSGIEEHQELSHAITEGTLLASYRFDNYKTNKKRENLLQETSFCVISKQEDVQAGIEIGKAYAEGTCLARDLVNTPGNLMTPTILAGKAKEIAERYNMECTILERDQMEELGMGALLAVAQGDVITSLSGKTIEVKNTDAEGRLILADGITYAKQLGANYLVDVATLTGAVLVALGDCKLKGMEIIDGFRQIISTEIV